MSQLDSWTLDPVFGCWRWFGRTDSRDGGALIWRGNKPFAAYRAVYELHEGPIASGLMLDHECRRRDCVRPAHLRPVTASENQRRRTWGYRCRIHKCKRGHSMREAIVVPDTMGRVCRECSRSDVP